MPLNHVRSLDPLCAILVILCDRNLDEEMIIEVVKISRCGNQLHWIIRKT